MATKPRRKPLPRKQKPARKAAAPAPAKPKKAAKGAATAKKPAQPKAPAKKKPAAKKAAARKPSAAAPASRQPAAARPAGPPVKPRARPPEKPAAPPAAALAKPAPAKPVVAAPRPKPPAAMSGPTPPRVAPRPIPRLPEARPIPGRPLAPARPLPRPGPPGEPGPNMRVPGTDWFRCETECRESLVVGGMAGRYRCTPAGVNPCLPNDHTHPWRCRCLAFRKRAGEPAWHEVPLDRDGTYFKEEGWTYRGWCVRKRPPAAAIVADDPLLRGK